VAYFPNGGGIELAQILNANDTTYFVDESAFIASWNNPEQNSTWGQNHSVDQVMYWFVVLSPTNP